MFVKPEEVQPLIWRLRLPDLPACCQEDEMLYALAVILLIAWLLGVVGTYTIGAFVHALLVIAIVLFVLGFLNGRRTPVA